MWFFIYIDSPSHFLPFCVLSLHSVDLFLGFTEHFIPFDNPWFSFLYSRSPFHVPSCSWVFSVFSDVCLQQLQTFRSLLHFELTFVQDERDGSSFIFLYLRHPIFSGTAVNTLFFPPRHFDTFNCQKLG